MHKLVIQDDEGKTTVVPLIRDEITVGRKEGNTIRLTERNVSRQHARIVRKNGSIAVEDLNSYNGVRVNGSRIQGRVGLNISDRVQIGDYVIEVKAENGVVDGKPYEGEETQPIDTANLRGSSPNLPVPQNLTETPTSKMPSPVAPMMPGASMPPQAPPAPAPAPADASSSATGLPQQVQEASFARLVVLSTNFAGREVELNKPAMVIGRTDDNDMVINHRSISRHHAKIVRENGRYAIVDLQSSNGVRVNGEEYSKVELRRGDVIDLGHVRLRFVEPGEDFVFGRDAHAVALPSGGNRGLLYGLVAVLVLGLIAVFALTRGDDEGEGAIDESEAVAQPAEGPEQDDGNEATMDTDEQKVAVAKGTDVEKLKPHIEAARSAIDEDDWANAIKAANEVLAIQPQNEEGKQLLSKAQLEQDNQELFNAFQRAIKKRRKDYKEVASTFEAIASDSIYKNRAREDHDRLHDEYTRKVLDQARVYARRGRCKELAELAARARTAWEDVGDQVASVECKRPQVASRKDPNKETDRGGNGDSNDPEDKPDNKPDNGGGSSSGNGGGSSKPSKSYDQLMAEAKDAAKSNQYGKARRLCADALKIRPRDAEAATLCGLAACNMKNAKLAKRYQNMVPAQRKQIIRQFCLKAGLRDFQ